FDQAGVLMTPVIFLPIERNLRPTKLRIGRTSTCPIRSVMGARRFELPTECIYEQASEADVGRPFWTYREGSEANTSQPNTRDPERRRQGFPRSIRPGP